MSWSFSNILEWNVYCWFLFFFYFSHFCSIQLLRQCKHMLPIKHGKHVELKLNWERENERERESESTASASSLPLLLCWVPLMSVSQAMSCWFLFTGFSFPLSLSPTLIRTHHIFISADTVEWCADETNNTGQHIVPISRIFPLILSSSLPIQNDAPFKRFASRRSYNNSITSPALRHSLWMLLVVWWCGR